MSFSKQTWTISYSELNDSILSFDLEIIDLAKKCKDPSWRMFPRPFGPFCLVVANNTTPLSRNTAASACKSKWGIGLTALNSIAERNYVLEAGKIAMGKHSAYKYSSMWLNGALKVACEFVGSEKTSGCAGMKAYDYIGDQITSFEAYQFAPGTPNYTTIDGSPQACLQLMMAQSETSNNGLVKNAV
uniref:C-type lectin domain-containing protein n=1 Tax=Caenorhabditis tropicalis TaxID=1561998 RepID=A0A1I7TX38_9PELO